MPKKSITVTSADPKFLYISTSGKWATIVTMSSLTDGGIPQVPDDLDAGDADEDATFIGMVDARMPIGEVDLEKFELPNEAKAEIIPAFTIHPAVLQIIKEVSKASDDSTLADVQTKIDLMSEEDVSATGLTDDQLDDEFEKVVAHWGDTDEWLSTVLEEHK